jgi:hypothetical protein
MLNYDKEFLKQLTEYPHHTTYIKISSLDINNNVIEEV